MPLLDGHALLTLLLAFAAITLLALVLRWTFGGSKGPRPPQPGDPEDFGLLTPVAAVDTVEEARRVRALLADAGIRATLGRSPDERHLVLVFPAELDRARRVGGWSA